MSAQGRGPDSTLVHMSPREVSGLQSLAMANGGTLTINPETGLPEAGFLDSLLPTLIGGAATFFSGGAITPFMAALGVGGLTALTSKDLGKGLMAGLGAYGGSGIAGGLMNFGEAAIGAEAASGALPAGVDKFGADAIAFEPQQLAAEKAARAGASNFDRLSRGVTEGFKNPMGAFSAIGGGSKLQGAAMIGAPLLSALSSQDQTAVPTFDQIKFDPRPANINIRRDQLPYQPDTGSSGQRGYFGPTDIGNYAADGGFVSNGGIEHFAAGGIPLDPDYDYSGYGRKKTDVVRPVTPMPDVPKPDFLAADGKTYRYDPIKRSWYVIKEAEAKTNPGVETLMGGEGRGNDSITSRDTAPIADNGFFSSILGRTTRTAAPVEEKSTYSTLAQAEADKAATAKQAASDAREDAREAKDAADQAARDAATSASSSTATGGKANSPSGIAALGVNLDAGELSNQAPTTTSLGDRLAANTAQASANVAATTAITDQMAIDGAQAALAAEGRAAAAAAAASDATQAAKDAADNPSPSLGTAIDTGNVDTGIGNFGDSNPDSIANGGMVGRYAQGGLGSLGGYSDGGRLLRGPGDGVSDSIPATVGGRQPARLADGEFVVPARIVSELGNGSTEAGARALYKMMDRIQANRRKTTGKNKVAVNSKSHKYLPA